MKMYPCVVLLPMLLCSMGASPAAGKDDGDGPSYQFSIDPNSLFIRAADEVLLQYRYGDTQPKSYVRELFTPRGLNVLLDSPADHVHHHGLMFACVVDGVDFWVDYVPGAAGNQQASLGRQDHRRFSSIGADGNGQAVGFAEDLSWVDPRRKTSLLEEQRTVRLHRVGGLDATLMTWQCRLTVAPHRGSAVLTGAHYHGLGMRFVRSMDAAGEFRNPGNEPGVIFRGEERLTRSRWCAYTAQTEGQTVTVAMFDHPENPRHPATWFTMAKPFAYMSATMKLHEEPLEMVTGKPLVLRYGIALWDGRVETSRIDAICAQWIQLTQGESGR